MASGAAKVFWVIWRQQGERVVGRPEPPWKTHSDCYRAVSASLALAQWCRSSYVNAEVLAVLRGDFAARWGRPSEFDIIDDPQNGGDSKRTTASGEGEA